MAFPKLKKLINISKFLDETPFTGKITFWVVIFLGLSFFITGKKVFLQNSYAGMIIFIQILLFGISLKHLSGKTFNKIWNANNGFVRKKWENLNFWSLKLTHLFLYLGIATLVVFHLVQSFLLKNSNSLLSYEQGAVGLVFLILIGWFIFGDKTNFSLPRHVALTYFLFMLFIIVYDFLLFEVIQITGGFPWTGKLEVPIILSLFGFLTMIFPEFFVIPILNFKQIKKHLDLMVESFKHSSPNEF